MKRLILITTMLATPALAGPVSVHVSPPAPHVTVEPVITPHIAEPIIEPHISAPVETSETFVAHHDQGGDTFTTERNYTPPPPAYHRYGKSDDAVMDSDDGNAMDADTDDAVPLVDPRADTTESDLTNIGDAAYDNMAAASNTTAVAETHEHSPDWPFWLAAAAGAAFLIWAGTRKRGK